MINTSEKVCEICQGRISQVSSAVFKCLNCRHDYCLPQSNDAQIENELLSIESVQKLDSLTRFKLRLVQNISVKNDVLVDIGSASGKFLYHAKNNFNQVFGVEVTESCIAFSRETLKLQIEKDFESISPTPDVITFWHSLEHIPIDQIGPLLKKIRTKVTKNSKIIISVPNTASFQYEIFSQRYTYFDEESHFHQFSPLSLEILMNKHGFKLERSFFSYIYGGFGWVQTLLNIFVKPHNFLYYLLKRAETRSSNGQKLKLILSLILLIPIFPISGMLVLLERCFLGKASVINHSYRPSL